MKQSKILFIGTLILGVFFAFKGVSAIAFSSQDYPKDLKVATHYSTGAAATSTLLTATTTMRTIVGIVTDSTNATTKTVFEGDLSGTTTRFVNVTTGLAERNIYIKSDKNWTVTNTVGGTYNAIYLYYYDYDITNPPGGILHFNDKTIVNFGYGTIETNKIYELLILCFFILIPIFLIVGLRRRK